MLCCQQIINDKNQSDHVKRFFLKIMWLYPIKNWHSKAVYFALQHNLYGY